jgi:hypothetical protein
MITDEFDLGVFLSVDKIGFRFVEFVKDAMGGRDARDCRAWPKGCAYRRCSGNAEHSAEEQSPMHDLLLSASLLTSNIWDSEMVPG